MVDFSALATSSSAERDGVWRTWTNGTHSIELRLARAGMSNSEFRRLTEEKTRSYRKGGVDVFQLPPEVQDRISREVNAECVILGWRGAAVDEIPFTRENVIALLTQVPDILAFVINESQLASNYREAQLETDAGN